MQLVSKNTIFYSKIPVRLKRAIVLFILSLTIKCNIHYSGLNNYMLSVKGKRNVFFLFFCSDNDTHFTDVSLHRAVTKIKTM